MVEKKITINQQLRWQAFLRQQLRAAFDLFHFGGYMNRAESGLGVEGRRNIERRIKSDPKIAAIVEKAKIEELAQSNGGNRTASARVTFKPRTTFIPIVSLDASASLHPWARDDLFVSAWHEVIHTQAEDKLNKNDFVLAHAVGNYFMLVQYPDVISSGRVLPERTAKLIEKSFVRGKKEEIIKSYGGHQRDAEYNAAFPSGESFADLGRLLARGAVRLEGQLGVPGIGLIFIREISRGGEFDAVVERVRRRKSQHTRELAAWYKRHPGGKKVFIDSKRYWGF